MYKKMSDYLSLIFQLDWSEEQAPKYKSEETITKLVKDLNEEHQFCFF